MSAGRLSELQRSSRGVGIGAVSGEWSAAARCRTTRTRTRTRFPRVHRHEDERRAHTEDQTRAGRQCQDMFRLAQAQGSCMVRVEAVWGF
ncbi:hypothetical protein MHYP_G00284430 [Metynnis hypsauchen]